MASRIEIERDASRPGLGDVQVVVDDQLLFRLERFPVRELARQLGAWAQRVDDEGCCECFVFELEGREDLLGSFRIEPRPLNWQLTSKDELARHDRLLPSHEVKLLVREFVETSSSEQR